MTPKWLVYIFFLFTLWEDASLSPSPIVLVVRNEEFGARCPPSDVDELVFRVKPAMFGVLLAPFFSSPVERQKAYNSVIIPSCMPFKEGREREPFYYWLNKLQRNVHQFYGRNAYKYYLEAST